MSVRRVASVLSVVLLSSGVALAQAKAPAKKAPTKKGPVAPAKEPAPAPTPAPTPAPADPLGAPAAPATPAGGENAGTAVEMAEDPAPADMEGTNENPDAPRVGDEQARVVPKTVEDNKRSGYPIEEVLRPITLPQNMSEVSIDMHAALYQDVGAGKSAYTGSALLRARYGITRQVQLGLNYLFGGIYSESKFGVGSGGTAFHPGKSVGLDVTVLIQNWIGVRVGVPVYIDPVAVGLQLGAPMKFVFFDKLSVTVLEDFLSIKLYEFAPSFYQETTNAVAAFGVQEAGNNTIQSDGYIQFSGTAAYQYKPNLALSLKFGVRLDDFESNRTEAGAGSGATSILRAGVELTAKKFLDIGGSLGFDDLSDKGSFGPQIFAAVRI